MTTTKLRLSILLALLALVAGSLVAQQAPPGLAEGLRSYQSSQFETALAQFRDAAEQAAGTDYKPYADFWVARSLMALERFTEAADAFDLFLSTYASHPYREEATYQRARLFYLNEEYEAAVQRFNAFLETYPLQTPFTGPVSPCLRWDRCPRRDASLKRSWRSILRASG